MLRVAPRQSEAFARGSRHKVGTQFSEELHVGLKRVLTLRQQNHKPNGPPPRLCDLASEAVEFFLRWIDRETGALLEPAPARCDVRHFHLQTLPSFSDVIDCNHIESDVSLFALMDASFLMLWASGPGLRNLYTNRKLCEYIGPVSYQGTDWPMLIHQEDRARIMQSSLEGIKSRQPLRRTYRLRRADGTYGRIAEQAVPWGRNGHYSGHIGTLHEIPLSGG